MNRPQVVYFPSGRLVYFPSGVRTTAGAVAHQIHLVNVVTKETRFRRHRESRLKCDPSFDFVRCRPVDLSCQSQPGDAVGKISIPRTTSSTCRSAGQWSNCPGQFSVSQFLGEDAPGANKIAFGFESGVFNQQLELVTLTFASWNHIGSWLSRLDALRKVA